MFPGAVERRNCIDRCAYASSTTLYPSHGHPRNFDIFDILGSCTVCTEIPLIYFTAFYCTRIYKLKLQY